MTCDSVIQINEFISPYDTGVDTTLTSGAAGDYLVLLEFNGTYMRITLELEASEDIILPTLNTQNEFMINGDYNHLMQIYKPDGTLLNDTCYSLCCRTVLTSGNGLSPSPVANPFSRIITITSDMLNVTGSELTNSLFGGKVINEINADSQSYLVGTAFTQNGNTITGTTISFYDGQIIKVSW